MFDFGIVRIVRVYPYFYKSQNPAVRYECKSLLGENCSNSLLTNKVNDKATAALYLGNLGNEKICLELIGYTPVFQKANIPQQVMSSNLRLERIVPILSNQIK
jgi:hypothetical protein